MHRRIFVSAALLAATTAPLAAQLDATSWGRHDKFVVANRGSSDLTLINARTAKVDRNVAVPAVGSTKSEPMYVVQVGDEVWVGFDVEALPGAVVADAARSRLGVVEE